MLICVHLWRTGVIMYLTHSVYQRQRRGQKIARCKRPQVALRLDQVPENSQRPERAQGPCAPPVRGLRRRLHPRGGALRAYPWLPSARASGADYANVSSR